MLDWDKLRVFHSVATAQSFTRAGDILNLSQSAISRQISSLEESLNVTLFTRHARGLMLTEQGDILFRTVSEVLTRLSTAENALLESRERPRGPLKITAPVALGTTWLTHRMREFMETYPEIAVHIMVSDREFDLTMREADVAIRLYPAKQPDLIQKKLTTLNKSVYASNDYLRVHGVPKNAQDLENHRLILFGDEQNQPYADVNWILKCFKNSDDLKINPLRINSVPGMLRAVKSGVGIAALPDYMIPSKNITKILPEVSGPKTDVFLIYSTDIRNSKRINVFKEFLLRKLAEDGLGRAF